MTDLNNSIFKWLDGISDSENLPDNIQAIYIGLFEGEENFYIYMIGSASFDEDDEDWACNDDFIPQSSYLDTCIAHSEAWEEFMDDVVDILKEYIDTRKDTILNKVSHVGIGFDDSNIYLVK